MLRISVLLVIFVFFSLPIKASIIDEYLIKLIIGNTKEKLEAVETFGYIKLRRAVFLLIDLLYKENNKRIRCEVISSLGLIGDRRALYPLVELLDSEDDCYRIRSSWALGFLGDKRAIKYLLKRIGDKNPWVRANVISSLAILRSEEAIPLVLKFLKDRDGDVRANAVKFFGYVVYPEALSELAQLKNDKSKWVRIFLAKVLGNYKNKEAINILLYLTKDEELWVRVHAYSSLIKLGCETEKCVNAYNRGLAYDSDFIKRIVAYKLYSLNISQSVPFFKKALETTKDSYVKKLAIRFLYKHKESLSQRFIENTILSNSPTLSCEAMWIVRKERNKDLVPLLIKNLNSKDSAIRLCAIMSLEPFCSESEVKEALFKMLSKEKNDMVFNTLREILKGSFCR